MPGRPEIPEAVFEELLVNALVHRDYLVSAPIRLFLFDDRIEIISPGHLPDHGLGSGIKRALGQWPDIDFKDDRDACLFISTIYRKKVQKPLSSGKSSEKTDHLIIENLGQNPQLTIKKMSEILNLSTRAATWY